MTEAISFRTRMPCLLLAAIVLACLAPAASAGLKALPPRTVVNLDGAWQVEQGGMETPPAAFTHTVAVPGLVDMAQPAFAEVGKKSALRQAFWYRRTFKVEGAPPEIAILKIHKARYGTKVWLNGKLVGEHLPCFTPAYLSVREPLKGGGAENELLVRVGADRNSLPQDMPTGWDIEKYLFIPGIYDSVDLILTDKVYASSLGPNSTVEQRRVLYARTLAAKTEFWRCHRECAGVLHFCGLGYSRPGDKPRPEGGATSDHWTDLEKLSFEPNFGRLVRDAFNPVGIMLDFWAEDLAPGTKQEVKVYVINDLYTEWRGKVHLKVLRGDKAISAESKDCSVAPLGREILTFTLAAPAEPGAYTAAAELDDGKAAPVRSLRDFKAPAK